MVTAVLGFMPRKRRNTKLHGEGDDSHLCNYAVPKQMSERTTSEWWDGLINGPSSHVELIRLRLFRAHVQILCNFMQQ